MLELPTIGWHNRRGYVQVCKSIPRDINDAHHNNVRTFLHNKLTLISQLYYRIKQLNTDAVNLKTQAELLDTRNRYLNGRLFLNTHKDWRNLNNELGLCCMNIFYFDIDKYPCANPSQWFGLCKTRILQLLLEYSSLKDDDIKKFLFLGLNYPKPLIDQDIKDLRAFGMVDSKLGDGGTISYEISKKGQLYLERSYTHIDSLYYFALDTPLPKALILGKFINSHDNKIGRKTNYPFAALSTAISFFIFLNYINDSENRILGEHLYDLKEATRITTDSLSLPFMSENNLGKLLRSGKYQLEAAAADRESLGRFERYLDLISS